VKYLYLRADTGQVSGIVREVTFCVLCVCTFIIVSNVSTSYTCEHTVHSAHT
jgi:hypothetical protein